MTDLEKISYKSVVYPENSEASALFAVAGGKKVIRWAHE
jgi:hypothetical protein